MRFAIKKLIDRYSIILLATLLSLFIWLPRETIADTNLLLNPSSLPFNPVELARPSFHLFTDKDGLPQNDIRTIAVDQKGYLWVGTDDGPAYYNGHKWTVVNLPNNSSKKANTIVATADGSLWFGTDTHLLKLIEGKWIIFDNTIEFSSAKVITLLPTKANDGHVVLFIGTDKGLFQLENGQISPYKNAEPILKSYIQFLLETTLPNGSKSLWVGTTRGLVSLAPDKLTIYDKSIGLPSNAISSVCTTTSAEGHSRVWIGTNQGLACIEEEKITLFDTSSGLPSNKVVHLCETHNDNGEQVLWVGTEDKGLVSYQGGKWRVYDMNMGLPDNHIASLRVINLPNGSATLFVGTTLGGLARLDLGKWQTLDTKVGLPSNPAFAFLETTDDKGLPTFWIGTDKGLVCWKKDHLNIYDSSNGLLDNWVFSLCETRSSTGKPQLWVGTNVGGISCLENGQWIKYRVNGNEGVHSLVETQLLDKRPTLLAALGTGKLAYFTDNQWLRYNPIELRDKRVFFLTEVIRVDGTRVLWAGTDKGLACFDGQTWKIYDTSNGLPNNFVISVLETTDTEGHATLWVGTGAGAAKCNISELALPKPNWVIFTEQSNPALPNSFIYQIRADAQKRIYLCTNKGIIRLTHQLTDNPTGYQAYVFNTEDGLPNLECNRRSSLIDHQGRLWVGTLGGIAILDPAQEVKDTLAKPLQIEQASLLNNATLLALNQTLTYQENNLSFEFSLVSYFKSADTRYHTQLVGLPEQPVLWTTDQKKEYTNLAAGNYTFRVWGKDYAGNISGPREFTFTITPPLWFTWPAYLLYLASIIGAIYFIIKISLYQLERHNQILAAKVAERTAELDNKNKELYQAIEEIQVAKKETEKKVEELAKKNEELSESHKRANRIFSALADVLPGTILDEKYRLESKIGAGGFGAVYRATHLILNRPVAVKVFRPSDKNATPESLERFRLEGVSACRVNHPNAISILDSGVSVRGIAYLVMELLEGCTLAEELNQKHRLSLRRTLQILIPICEVLSKAHASGIIHRDIKPDNIFLHRSPEGEIVKVVDFGIAKLVDNEDASFESLTGTGSFIGTPAYMPPERLNNKPYDGQSDVYSLGIMLYKMLSGRVPFRASEGEGALKVILAHLSEEPPPLKNLLPTIPDEVANIIMATLNKDPKLRPSTKELAQRFADALGISLEANPSGTFKFSLSELNEISEKNPEDLANQLTAEFTASITLSRNTT